MATATISDLLCSTNDGTRPQRAALSSQKNLGSSFLQTANLTGWPVESAVHFTLFKVDPTKLDAYGNPIKISGSQSDWKGVRNGNNIEQLQLMAGTDDNYPVGSVIVCAPTSAWADDLMTGLVNEHDRQGHHGDIHPTSVVSSGLITAQNGLTVQSGSTAFPAKSIQATALNKPAMLVSRFTPQSLSSTSEVIVQFDGEIYKNNTAMHNIGTHPEQLIAPLAGIYGFTYSLNFAAGFSGNRVIVTYRQFDNTSQQLRVCELFDGTVSGSAEPSLSLAWATSMAANDYVTIGVYSVNASSANLAGVNSGGQITNGVTMTMHATL